MRGQRLSLIHISGTGGHTQAQRAEVFVQQVEDLVVVVRRQDAQLAVHAPLQLFALLLLLRDIVSGWVLFTKELK